MSIDISLIPIIAMSLLLCAMSIISSVLSNKKTIDFIANHPNNPHLLMLILKLPKFLVVLLVVILVISLIAIYILS